MTLREELGRLTVEGELYEPLPEARVRCAACGHRCVIPPGREGVCRVRFNRGGRLRVPFGYVGALQVDPVEKKPFFHALPGTRALSFGMLGCDYHCAYCQNWLTSQALRDPNAEVRPRVITALELVHLARRHGARIVTATYNEPLITSEWAAAVFRAAREAGLLCSYVSNGNATAEVLDYLRPWIALYKVDLKSFRDQAYRRLGGTLERVLWTIRALHAGGVWLEVVTLCVPGLNDSPEELRDIARFLVSISPDIPWHVTAFHPDYRMSAPAPTTVHGLLRAAEIGRGEGLRFVYVGNVPGAASEWEQTRCPDCSTLLIARRGFEVVSNRLSETGRCPSCERVIPGVWR